MAWTKAKTVAVGMGLLLVAGTGTVLVNNTFLNPREPSYQGRRLLEWLPGIAHQQPPDIRAQAAEAIRKMGSKTLPFLLADLAIAQQPGQKKVRYTAPDTRTTDERCSQATWAFDALGPLGKSAIPELNKLLEQNPGYAPLALGGIGRDALPDLLKALTNQNFWVRDNTAAALANALYSGKIRPADASPALPIALDNLTYTDTNTLFMVNTRFRAASLIGALKLEPDVSVPALIRALEGTNLTVRMESASALAAFRQEAQSAIPALERAAAAKDPLLSSAAARALTSITARP